MECWKYGILEYSNIGIMERWETQQKNKSIEKMKYWAEHMKKEMVEY